jgi:hypothetical protein
VGAPDDGLTPGHCVDCRGYGRGRFLRMIGDQAQVITEHVGCRGSVVAEQPVRRDLQGSGNSEKDVDARGVHRRLGAVGALSADPGESGEVLL